MTIPARADHVGSLLRPAAAKQARKLYFEDHSISSDALETAEDAVIRGAVAMQESIGLQVVTDGV